VSSIGPEALSTLRLIAFLEKTGRKNGAAVWRACAERLRAPARARSELNLSRLNAVTKEGETVAFPGKLLAQGDVTHSLVVGYFKASKTALIKLKKTKCEALPLAKLAERNPQGKKVRIIL
jgi:large subunit ribosomal protein L18e